jgi:hypothetical protein
MGKSNNSAPVLPVCCKFHVWIGSNSLNLIRNDRDLWENHRKPMEYFPCKLAQMGPNPNSQPWHRMRASCGSHHFPLCQRDLRTLGSFTGGGEIRYVLVGLSHFPNCLIFIDLLSWFMDVRWFHFRFRILESFLQFLFAWRSPKALACSATPLMQLLWALHSVGWWYHGLGPFESFVITFAFLPEKTISKKLIPSN